MGSPKGRIPLTATRSIVASLVAVTLIAVGVFFWVQTRSGCPSDYTAADTYQPGDEVRFAGQVWRTNASGSTQVPGPRATEWTAAGTC